MAGASGLASLLAVPARWLGRSALFPAAALVYRFSVRLQRAFALATASMQVRLSRIFTARHVTHVVVVALALFVTTSNIYASNSPIADDVAGASILADFFKSQEEELLIEEYDGVETHVTDTAYLEGQAVRPGDAVVLSDTQITDLAPEEGTEVPSSALADGLRGVQIDDAVSSTAIAAAAPARAAITEYVVQNGDTPAGIAKRYGITTQTLLLANGLGSSGIIRPGQSLKILPVSGVLYTVRKGDTLSKIARTYQSTIDDVLSTNGLVDAGQIAVGTILILPGGKLPAAPVTVPKPTRLATDIRDVFSPKPASSPDAASAKTKLVWPTAARRITQYYKKGHTGLDIAGPIGTAIYAADAGTVIFSGWNSGGYGNMIIVDHGSGLFTRYGHASKMLVKVGEKVKRGETIALVGSTGRSTGPHLHFEVMVTNVSKRVNPFDYTSLK